MYCQDSSCTGGYKYYIVATSVDSQCSLICTLICMKCSQPLKNIKTDEMSFSYMHSLKRPHSIQQKIQLWKDTGLSCVFDCHCYDFHIKKETCSRKSQSTVIKTTGYSGSSFALRQDQIFSALSQRVSSDLYS